MFIIRYSWIIVFLAVSSLLTGFQMVECKPVPSSFSSLSGLRTITASRQPQSTLPSTRSTTRSSSMDGNDYDEENTIETEGDVEGEEENLEPIVVRIYGLHSICSGRSIQLIGKKLNQVRAEGTSNSPYAQLTVRSVRPGEISISNEMSQRYLCFNRQGKLIMRLEFQDDSCVFHERVQESYVVMQSAYNKTWFVGFSRDGRSLQGAAWRKKLPKNRGCYNFMKTGEKIYQSLGDINHSRSAAQRQRIHRIMRKHRLLDSSTRQPVL